MFSAPDQVLHRHPDIGEGQLGGVGGSPAHLGQLPADLEAGCALLDHQHRDPRRARAAGADRGHHVVAAHRRGDVGLGAVDDVVVAVADRGGAQVADVGAAARFGDGQRADQFTAQGGLDELLDQSRIAGGDHVRHRDTDGEQRRENPAGSAGLVQFLADDRHVGRIAALAADLLGEADAEQAGLRRARGSARGAARRSAPTRRRAAGSRVRRRRAPTSAAAGARACPDVVHMLI